MTAARMDGHGSISQLARGLVRLHAEQIGEDSTLFRSKDTLITGRVEHSGTLFQGNRAQILKGMFHQLLAANRQSCPAARGEIDSHPLLGRQVLNHFGTRHAALPLLFRQLIHLVQLRHDPLLLRSGKPAEVRIAAQNPFLLLNGKVAVLA